MTDDEILDRWHQAKQVHAQAAELDMLEAYIAKMAAEDAAMDRFGPGGHHEAYRARFPAEAHGERTA